MQSNLLNIFYFRSFEEGDELYDFISPFMLFYCCAHELVFLIVIILFRVNYCVHMVEFNQVRLFDRIVSIFVFFDKNLKIKSR